MTTRDDAAEVQAYFQGDIWRGLPLRIQNAISALIGFASQIDDDRARAAWMVSELSEESLAAELLELELPDAPLQLQQAGRAAQAALIWTVDQLRAHT